MTATIIGATGLIGNHLLEELLKDNYYDTVRILVRRPYEFSHSKLEKKLVDFSDGDSILVAIANSDVVFCAIGTTQQKVKGDKEAYRKVDYDIAVNAARFCKITGCEKFVLVSSVGANSKSNNFYLKLKGEIEEAVKAVGLKTVHIMRPSVLLGERKEFRLAEKISKGLMKMLSFLIPSKYKPIHGKEVVKAMIYVSKLNTENFYTHEYKSIKTLADSYLENPEVLNELDKTAFHKRIKYELQVKIIEFVDDSNPGFVKCMFTDITGKEYSFIEKVPIVSYEFLDQKSQYPQNGEIECIVLKREIDEVQNEIITIDLSDRIETENKETIFKVFSNQIIEVK